MPGIDYNVYGYKTAFYALLNRGNFEIVQALEDPLLNLVESRILKAVIDGEDRYLKLLMGDSFHTMATKHGQYSFDVNPGSPIIEDATIDYKLLSARFLIDGSTVKLMKSTDATSRAMGLDTMLELYKSFLKKTKYRLLAGDGSGRLFYVKANSGTSQFAVEDDGTTILSGASPAWKWMQKGQRVDIVNATTGLAVEGGVDVEVQSIVKATGAIVIDETVAVTASKAYYFRLHTPHSDSTDKDYDTNCSLLPEPAGIPGVVTTTASLYGYSSASYANWYSPAKDMDGVAPGVEDFDELFSELDVRPGMVCIGDGAVISQLKKELVAKGMYTMTKEESIYVGIGSIKYPCMNINQQDIPLLTSPEFNGQRKIFFVAPDMLAEKGTSIKPEWKRNELTWGEGENFMYDDTEMDYELYTGARKCHGMLYDCGAAYGWNKVTV